MTTDKRAGAQRQRYDEVFKQEALRLWQSGGRSAQAPAGGHRPAAIERPAERIDDAPQQAVAHGHIHDPPRALDFIAGVQMRVFAEQHDADFVLVHIERDAEDAARKLEQLLKPHAGQAGNPGDARGYVGDRPDLARRQLRREGTPNPVDSRERAFENALQSLGRYALNTGSVYWLKGLWRRQLMALLQVNVNPGQPCMRS